MHQLNSAFHPSGAGISNTRLPAEVKAGRIHLCRVAGNTMWSHMAGIWHVAYRHMAAYSSVMGVSLRDIRDFNV